MLWLEEAWEQDGLDTLEVKGRDANTNILKYFSQIGRPDITSDEIAWCAAFYFWCLWKAGIDLSDVPLEKRLLAVSALLVGTRLAEPRVGAGCVLPRYEHGKLVGHHVGFVIAWTEKTIELLGGNQANQVCCREFKRTKEMKFIWPEPPKTPKEVAQAGSRTVAAANRQIADGTKTGAVNVAGGVLPAPAAAPPSLPAPEMLMGKATAWQGMASTFESLAMFTWSKWPWILAAFSIYWVARMGWDALQIRWFRTQDANTGKAPVIAAPDVVEGEWEVINEGEPSLA